MRARRRFRIAAALIGTIMFVGCGGDEGDEPAAQIDSRITEPTAMAVANAATAEFDGYAVIGCDDVLITRGQVVLNRSAGDPFPQIDYFTTARILERSESAATDPVLAEILATILSEEIADQRIDQVLKDPSESLAIDDFYLEDLDALEAWCVEGGLLPD